MLIETLSVPMFLTNAANSTAASITEPVPTVTKPSGDGVITMGDGGGPQNQSLSGQHTASAVKLVFFGAGADNNTFSANVYGWEMVHGPSGKPDLWVPVLLCAFTSITLDSAQPGVDGTDVPSTGLFATAITLSVGNQGTDVDVVSPGHAAHEIAHATIDSKGCRLLEVRFAKGTATSVNALVRKM